MAGNLGSVHLRSTTIQDACFITDVTKPWLVAAAEAGAYFLQTIHVLRMKSSWELDAELVERLPNVIRGNFSRRRHTSGQTIVSAW